MQVIWTDPALERVDETAVYIAQDDPAAADRWTLELFAAVERLIDFPESGRMVPELATRDVRECLPLFHAHVCIEGRGDLTAAVHNCILKAALLTRRE